MKNLGTCTEDLQRKGILIFTLEQLENHFPDKSRKALELNLFRLSRSEKIKSVYKGGKVPDKNFIEMYTAHRKEKQK